MAKGKTGPKTKHVTDQINPDEVLKLAAMQCTTQEISDFFGCSKDTIERNFAAQITQGRSKGVVSMKRSLFEKVQKGDMSAIIWFGKNYAGMADKVEQKTEGINTFHVNVKEVTDLLSEHKDLINKTHKT